MMITIDGPASSGKSSTARALAQKLHYCHINSGLLFRALAYLLIQKCHYDSLELQHPKQEDIDCYFNDRFIRYVCGTQAPSAVLIEGTDITQEISTAEYGEYASIVSTNAYARTMIENMQRSIANKYSCVVDGRDAGSVVFPHAEIKFFLTASIEVRAARWLKDQERQGKTYSFEQAQEYIQNRDTRDQSRAVAPLKIPDDALIIDNSLLNLDQTVHLLLDYIKKGRG